MPVTPRGGTRASRPTRSSSRRARVAAATLAAVVTLATADARADEKAACIAASVRGQQLALDHKPIEARALFVECARMVCPGPVRADCAEQIAAAERSISSIVLEITPHRDALGDARVLVDGGSSPDALEGRAIPLNPGRHKLEVESDRWGRVERSWVAVEGSKLQTVEIAFPTTAAGRREPYSPAPARPPPSSASRLTPAVLTFGALSLAGLGSFSYFGIRAVTTSADLHARSPSDLTDREVTVLKRDVAVADISLAVTLVALGITTFMLLRHRPPGPPTF